MNKSSPIPHMPLKTFLEFLNTWPKFTLCYNRIVFFFLRTKESFMKLSKMICIVALAVAPLLSFAERLVFPAKERPDGSIQILYLFGYSVEPENDIQFTEQNGTHIIAKLLSEKTVMNLSTLAKQYGAQTQCRIMPVALPDNTKSNFAIIITQPSGLAFTIPANKAKDFWNEAVNLGLDIQPNPSDITSVAAKTPNAIIQFYLYGVNFM
jgi:hypothetical protein